MNLQENMRRFNTKNLEEQKYFDMDSATSSKKTFGEYESLEGLTSALLDEMDSDGIRYYGSHEKTAKYLASKLLPFCKDNPSQYNKLYGKALDNFVKIPMGPAMMKFIMNWIGA